MQPDRLVYMANQIGKFFTAQRADEVVPGIANHIKKFWDPRMRQAIFAYIDANGGEGLDPPVLEALTKLKAHAEQPGTPVHGMESSFQGT
jgi:formate dehydrogenase subunit delta